MLRVCEYSPDYKNEWNEFVKNSKNNLFMFNRNFMEYHSDRFIDNSLMFFENDELLAIIPISRHNDELRSHGGLTYGGFIANERMKQHKMITCFELLKDYMQKNNFKRLIYKATPYIYHTLANDEDLYALYKVGAKILKLEPSSTIFLNNPIKMPKGRKAQISRAKREGVVVEQSLDFENFINLENSILEKHHNTKAVHTAEELKLLNSRFENEIQLWVAKYKNEIIAATLLFVYENVVHTQYMAANDTAREIGALDLLIKTLIDKFATNKMYFDFGISTEDNGKHLNEGLISQKEGFGGRTVCYQTWEIGI